MFLFLFISDNESKSEWVAEKAVYKLNLQSVRF